MVSKACACKRCLSTLAFVGDFAGATREHPQGHRQHGNGNAKPHLRILGKCEQHPTDTLSILFQFAGQYTDMESGLYYLRARFYDSATAQFISRDPLAASTRSPYTYGAGNPTNVVDASGLGFWGWAQDRLVGIDRGLPADARRSCAHIMSPSR